MSKKTELSHVKKQYLSWWCAKLRTTGQWVGGSVPLCAEPYLYKFRKFMFLHGVTFLCIVFSHTFICWKGPQELRDGSGLGFLGVGLLK